MEKFGDPGFHRHVNLAKVRPIPVFVSANTNLIRFSQALGLAALRLADSPILPINTTRYTEELYNYLASLKQTVSSHNVTSLDYTRFEASLGKMWNSTHALDAEAANVSDELARLSEIPCSKKRGKAALKLMKRVRSINKRKQSFEQTFITKRGGLPTRPWYKHLAVAPGLNLGYGATTYPGVTEAVTIFKDENMAKRELEKLARAIRRGAGMLLGSGDKDRKEHKKHHHKHGKKEHKQKHEHEHHRQQQD